VHLPSQRLHAGDVCFSVLPVGGGVAAVDAGHELGEVPDLGYGICDADPYMGIRNPNALDEIDSAGEFDDPQTRILFATVRRNDSAPAPLATKTSAFSSLRMLSGVST